MTLAELSACCGSSEWAQKMFERQPFADTKAMHVTADEMWWSLGPSDWLEAFSKHPRIGQQSGAKWSSQEQSGMATAGKETVEEIARLNTEYDSKFGFTFIVCATGRDADEMLRLLRSRLSNSRQEEIYIAALEQARITHLRLDKLLAE